MLHDLKYDHLYINAIRVQQNPIISTNQQLPWASLTSYICSDGIVVQTKYNIPSAVDHQKAYVYDVLSAKCIISCLKCIMV